MDTKTLARLFEKDPASVFLEVVKASAKPIRAQDIKQQVVDAGAKKADVDRHWPRIQRVIKLHPQIKVESNKYEWSSERQPATSSLNVLASNLLAKLPAWLSQPLIQNVADALANPSTDGGRVDHEFEKARIVANLAVAVEVLQTRGDTIAEVVKLFGEEARRKRLWPLGQPGETVAFDPELHEVEVDSPNAEAVVRVVRSGYVWRGGGAPNVAVKAIVTV